MYYLYLYRLYESTGNFGNFGNLFLLINYNYMESRTLGDLWRGYKLATCRNISFSQFLKIYDKIHGTRLFSVWKRI